MAAKELLEKSRKSFYYKKRIEVIKKLLSTVFSKNIKKQRITLLDVGCGVGSLFDSLDNREDMVCLGIDINESYVKFAKERGHNVIFGDINNIQLEEEYFDIVTLIEVLEHLNNPILVLEKCYKFLKKDGVLIITVPSLSLYRFLLYKCGAKKNIKISATEHNFELSPGIYRLKNSFWVSYAQLFNLLENGGFEIKYIRGIISLEFPIISKFMRFFNPLDDVLGKCYKILGCRYLLVVAKRSTKQIEGVRKDAKP